MARLRLQIAELNPPLEGSLVVLGIGDTQTISATVAAEDCMQCRMNLIADKGHFSLIMGEEEAEIGGGTFDRTLQWQLRAIAPGDQLSIRIEARADGAYQAAMVPVRIHPVLRIED